MTGILHLDPASKPRDVFGRAMPYATLTFLRTGTDEVLATYTADSAGVFATITPSFDTYVYRVQLKDAAGVLRYDVDPYRAGYSTYVDARSQRLESGAIVPNTSYTFTTDGTTLKSIYADDAMTVQHPNPIKTDSSGLLPPIYLTPAEYFITRGGGGGGSTYFPGVTYPADETLIGGTVVFVAAAISGAGGSSTRGYNSATAANWIGNPTTCAAAGTLTSGRIAGKTDFGIGTYVGSGFELSVRIRVVTGTGRASPQTAYFTGLTIAGIKSGATAAGAAFVTDTTSDVGYTTYKWVWSGGSAPSALMANATGYTAVFT